MRNCPMSSQLETPPASDGRTTAGWAQVWCSQCKRDPNLCIFLLALFLRLLWVLSLTDSLIWDDEREFVRIGQGLAQGLGYHSMSFRAYPGLPFYLSLIFRVWGRNYFVARLGQCVFGALTCVWLSRLGTLAVGAAVGRVAGLLVAVYPPYIYLTGVFYVDCLLTCLLALAVYLATCALRSDTKLRLALATGLTLGLTILTRPTFMLYLPVLLFLWLFLLHGTWWKRFAMCIVLSLAVAAVVLPWSWRNWRTFHRLILVSSGFYFELWQGNNELATGSPSDRVMSYGCLLWKERLQKLPPQEQQALTAKYEGPAKRLFLREEELGDSYLAYDEVMKPVTIRLILTNPLRTLELCLKKLMTLYSAFSTPSSTNRDTSGIIKRLAAMTFYPVLGLGLVGAWLGLAHWRDLLPTYSVVGMASVAYASLVAATRYRLPIDGFWILFAALAVVRFTEWVRQRT